ncbi:hypothetical protein Cni_G18224 [Canna indica]|uniref:Glycosyltransferase 61 catalytic domain-containing protein n=1 Tax=Canna indica TaxID=4628 RepID=A0AAQ3QE63_9LILI|nr:hypothetical protein Cni_G18224 [Canna indica]
MKPSDSFSHVQPRKLSSTALCGCLLMAFLLLCFMTLIKSSCSNASTTSVMKLQLSIYKNVSLFSPEESMAEQVGLNANPSLSFEEAQVSDAPIEDESLPMESLDNKSRVVCDFTGENSDTCWIDGDIRVVGELSTVILASPPIDNSNQTENRTWKIRPYTRKFEPATQQLIKEITVTAAEFAPLAPPRCMINHSVPALFFSTGGFVGNYFHDFSDVIIPLFMTGRRFNGQVQFVVSDFNHHFIDKYQPILKRLSHYPAINLDADDRVHCFPHAHVGLLSHKVLGIDSSRSPNGVSMPDFRDLLRTSFSLERSYSKGLVLEQSKNASKPKALLILRKGSRSFINEAPVMSTLEGIGLELITAGPEEAKNLSGFAKMVNSVDVLIGVHGAGLTNMLFLPANATLVQIVPCCGLKAGCRYLFADPAPDMGIRYVDYEIRDEESSLIELYPRDDAVFKDPLSIQKRPGFFDFWNIYLNQQKIKLDVDRFKTTMLSHILQSTKT